MKSWMGRNGRGNRREKNRISAGVKGKSIREHQENRRYAHIKATDKQ
jgi:cytidylate kinase